MKSITVQELHQKLANNEDIQLIDVREDYEFDDYNIGGKNIPMDVFMNSLDQIDQSKDCILCCKSGKRSKALVHSIKRKLNLDNFISVEGGVLAYQAIMSK